MSQLNKRDLINAIKMPGDRIIARAAAPVELRLLQLCVATERFVGSSSRSDSENPETECDDTASSTIPEAWPRR